MLALSCYGNSHNPALIMLHGFMGSQKDWLSLIPHLTKYYYCVCVDLPGHGQSPSLMFKSLAFKQVVTLIQTSIEKLGITHYHLLGYSLGGRIALHLAREHTDKILSLCLESCHPGLKTAQERQQRAKNDLDWSHKLTNLPISKFVTLWYQQSIFSELSSEVRQQLINKRQHNSKHGLLSIYLASSLAKQDNLWDLPNLISIPCHYIVGSKDHKFSTLATYWQQNATVKVQIIEHAGHNVHLADPMNYSNRLIQILTEDKL